MELKATLRSIYGNETLITKVIKEVCTDGLKQSIEASDKGADRIEFCADLSVGGVTPKISELEEYVKDQSRAKLAVMVRPRGGNFAYT